ncbi:ATP-dependent nuclease [Tenacibaculum ovolyticum]|uniref:ATP-dependent nuclease n=1 Tax=Tenacibaculum ovolyticum TaxID=104270 RepID=UPI001F460880|nr:ATP-binding protein [Tenacibaculum ovolyticum]
MIDLFNKIEQLVNKGKIEIPLKYLEILKFRNFEKNSKIIFNHPLTVLVGKNGSGKSTILKLIKSLSKDSSPDEYFFQTEWDKSTSYNDCFRFQYKEEEIEQVNFKNFGWVYKNQKTSLVTNKQIKEYLEKPIDRSNKNIIDIEFKKHIGAFEKNTFFDVKSQKETLQKKVEYAKKVTKKVQQSINTKGNIGNKSKSHIVSEKNLEFINTILGKEYNQIQIIEHKFFSGSWGTSVIFSSNEQYSEANAGSGEFIITNVISRLETAKTGSIVLLDEPELSLHPGAQKRFFQYLLNLIIRNKIQLIISTHSTNFVEKIPSTCIKNLSQRNNCIEIESNINYLNAFENIEVEPNIPKIFVEDSLAKEIVLRIAKKERKKLQFDVELYSGGASNIKKNLIRILSKINEKKSFILLDGDMFKKDAIRLNEIPEECKTLEFLEKEIYDLTNIKIKSIGFDFDGSSGNANGKDKKRLYELYINFFSTNVFYLPSDIPEDIIFDCDYLYKLFPSLRINELSGNSKKKIKDISIELNLETQTIIDILIKNFIENRDSNYLKINKVLDDTLMKSLDVK